MTGKVLVQNAIRMRVSFKPKIGIRVEVEIHNLISHIKITEQVIRLMDLR